MPQEFWMYLSFVGMGPAIVLLFISTKGAYMWFVKKEHTQPHPFFWPFMIFVNLLGALSFSFYTGVSYKSEVVIFLVVLAAISVYAFFEEGKEISD